MCLLLSSIIVQFFCILSDASARKHHGHKREIEVKRATFNVTLDGTVSWLSYLLSAHELFRSFCFAKTVNFLQDSTETTADILTRLKLLAYAEKLKAKQAKKKAKADKKAQKEKAWNAYLMSLVPPAPGADGSTAGTGTGAAGTAGTAPALPPAMGLWKKSFLLSQLAMAQAQAAAAAAAAEATTTAAPDTNAPAENDSAEEE